MIFTQVKTRLADDCALRVECRLVIDPAPLLDRALKRLSDALATRAPEAPPATPQTPPRERAAACKNGDGCARALRRDAAQAARCRQSVAITQNPAGAAVATRNGFEDFSSPARRQAHPVGRSPRSRCAVVAAFGGPGEAPNLIFTYFFSAFLPMPP